MFKHGSLFSGIGGFETAAEWMGWENVFHCEYNPFGQRVLKHYWPNSISYGDIKQTDFTIHRGQIDILTGGFPCQPFSSAGKRKGTEDDRHLWPEMLRAIREIQPAFVVGENVRGLLNWSGGLVFEQVQIDLENEGYEVTPFLLPACAVNAPHRRDRVWFVAQNTNQNGRGGIKREEESSKRRLRDVGTGNNERLRADNEDAGTTPNALRYGRSGEHEVNPNQRGFDALNDVGQNEGEGTTTDTKHLYTQDKRAGERRMGEEDKRWKAGGFKHGNIQTNWDSFPTTEPTIRSRNDGLPAGLSGITVPKHRKESIMAYGNAIVPQVAFEIFKAIEASFFEVTHDQSLQK